MPALPASLYALLPLQAPLQLLPSATNRISIQVFLLKRINYQINKKGYPA
jgi:hypothetical protein